MQTFRASITIMLRKAILDVQGKTVEHSLHSIGFENLTDVHIGKHVMLHVQADSRDAAMAQVDEACKKLIANPVMEDYEIELSEVESAGATA